MRTLLRISIEIGRAIRHEILPTLGTLFTVFLAMTLPLALWIISNNLSIVEHNLKSGLTMDVFLTEELPPDKIAELKFRMESIDGIEKARYLSGRDALYKMREAFGLDMVKDLEGNPLPASFILDVDESLYEPVAADSAIAKISKLPGVEDVVFAAEMLNRLRHILRSVKILWLAIALLVAFSAIFIVANTVRVAVADRRKAVEIMQLVGATRNYIMVPFVLLGGILGFLGAGMASLFLWLATGFISMHLTKVVFLSVYDITAFILTGLLLGMIGALVATKRHLKI